MTKIRILGWLHVLLGGGGLLLGSVLCLQLMKDPQGGPTLYYVGPIFVMIATAFFLPGLIGGLGLLSDRGWARIVIGIFSGLLILSFPIGTPLGVFGLWALFGAKPPAPAPPAPPRLNRFGGYGRARGRGLVAVLLSMGAVGAGFAIALNVGFLVHRQTAPNELAAAFIPGILVFAGCIGALYVLRPFAEFPDAPRPLNPFAQARLRARLRREHQAFLEAEARRTAALLADPTRRKYVALMEAGQYWSDEQIAYDLDPDRLVTCAHLQPIERAMRDGPFGVRFWLNSSVNAQCRIDEPGLMAQFQPDPGVGYHEFYQGGRAAEDFPTAQVSCATCRSVIQTLHPLEATSQTPWFPAPPAE